MEAWQIALLAFLGIKLLGGMGGQSQPAPVFGASGGGGGFFFTQPQAAADVTPGLIFMSADEDIGIPPAPIFAAPAPTVEAARTVVVVQDSNTPVIEQTPIFLAGPRSGEIFTVEGSTSQGFTLSGPTENLSGTDQIRVGEFVGFAEDETFVTTPDVLAAYLAQFN